MYAAGGGPGTVLAPQSVIGVVVVGHVAFVAGELRGARAGLLAGSFADLHVHAARAYAEEGDAARAAFHARRAEVLGAVARQTGGVR